MDVHTALNILLVLVIVGGLLAAKYRVDSCCKHCDGTGVKDGCVCPFCQGTGEDD
ncbi:chaperone protein [Erwinia phage Tian]|nr:chaperone protein [Erwinia phage Pistou]WJN65021.1 chaperone protein [Erwinia phage Tian]